MHITSPSKQHFRTAFGNLIEWYDFGLYGYLASFLSKHLLPASETHSLVIIFLIFASGIVSRLLGGIAFSHWGDTHGRQRALNFSILIMTFPTVMMGLIPSYQTIGLFAPILLLLLRIIQGISAGGQYSGALTVLGDANPNRRARQCAFAYIYSIAGFLLANVVCQLSLAYTPMPYHHTLAWRIPFFMSAILAVIAFKILPPPKPTPQKHRTSPLHKVFKHHKKPLLYSTIIATISGIYYYYIYVYLISHMIHDCHYKPKTAYIINGICLILSCGLVMLFANLSDKKGRTPLFVFCFVAFLLFSMPLTEALSSPHFITQLLSYGLLIGLFTAFTANAAAVYGEIFPTSIRYTGLAISYNGGLTLSGFTPALFAWLQHTHQTVLITTSPLLIASAIGLLSLFIRV